MSFLRTNNSFHAVHLFWQVDIVAFCEGGGENVKLEDIPGLKKSTLTPDVRYWTVVLTRKFPTAKIKILSVGNKTAVKEIYKGIKDSGSTHIHCCFDSDYEELLGTKTTENFVWYTWGYSWENDVFSPEVVDLVVRSFCSQPHLFDDLNKVINDILMKGLGYCETDIALIKKGRNGLFVRNSPGGNFLNSNWNKSALKKQISKAGYRRGPRKVVRMNNIDVRKHIFGKLLPHLVLRLIVEKDAALKSISNTAFCLIALSFFELILAQNSHSSICSRYES